MRGAWESNTLEHIRLTLQTQCCTQSCTQEAETLILLGHGFGLKPPVLLVGAR